MPRRSSTISSANWVRADAVRWWCSLIVILKQAFFAQRRIWASRAKRRVPCDAIIARLARFLTKLHHRPLLRSCTHRSILVRILVSGIVPHTSGGDTNSMTYVIAEPCIGTKDTACVDACPVDCIHPKKDEPAYAEEEMLYIDPVDRKSVV